MQSLPKSSPEDAPGAAVETGGSVSLSELMPSLLVAVAYLVASLRLTEFRGLFEIDPDEGNNLIKALLLDRGYHFLSEIWSDQPPLFAYVLWGVFEIFGWKVSVARELVLGSSAVLGFALYDSVVLATRRRFGLAAAHVGAAASFLLLTVASGFAVLRVSVMLGMPSIALAALGMWAALRASGAGGVLEPKQRRGWLVAAGAFFGLSMGTKLFTAFILPIAFATALAPAAAGLIRGKWREQLAPTLALVFACVGVLLVTLAPALLSGSLSELYLSHAAASDGQYRSSHTVTSLMARDQWIYLMALFGVGLCAWKRVFAALPWLAWLGLGVAILSRHDPLWAHHGQLLIVPALALAGMGVSLLIGLLPTRERWPAATSAALVLLVGCWFLAADRLAALRQPYGRADDRERAALQAMRELGVRAGMMVTSRQIYAFYLGLAVPPRLSVTSAKRFRSGRLSAQTIVKEIRDRRAELVVLSKRWPGQVRERVRRAIASDYDQVYADPKNQSLEVYRRRAPGG